LLLRFSKDDRFSQVYGNIFSGFKTSGSIKVINYNEIVVMKENTSLGAFFKYRKCERQLIGDTC